MCFHGACIFYRFPYNLAWPWTHQGYLIHCQTYHQCEAWLCNLCRKVRAYHFNSHASCEAWHADGVFNGIQKGISTHTPHARRDSPTPALRALLNISTHTPHARRDRDSFVCSLNCTEFQLTRLMRGVTSAISRLWANGRISTHTPHARRDHLAVSGMRWFKISTHTPHARRDLVIRTWIVQHNGISTHTPHARRDDIIVSGCTNMKISTHTPHARRDRAVQALPDKN